MSSWCKDCRSEKRKITAQEELAKQRARRSLKPCKTCQSTEKEKGKTYCYSCLKIRTRQRKSEEKCLFKTRLRKAKPIWADTAKIREFYKNKPEGMHVDHIIPLRGEFVCGLHVEYNLQYLDAMVNMRKSNKFQDGNHYSLEWEGKK